MTDGMPQPTEEDALIEGLAGWITNRGLTLPAVLFMESFKPLSFLGGQLMTFLEPMVGSFVASRQYTTLTHILEDRDKFEQLIRRVESRSTESEESRDA